jgi:signal transduction histidine kinase
VDLAELVQGVIDMLRHVGRFKNKRIELTAAGPVIASVNVQQLRVVVLNLLGHGLNSVEPGGQVTVELQAADDALELSVSDDGRGMTKAELADVFEPCALRQTRQGTGLGLAISARIVKDHGGCITAASAGPGHGTQFRVCLPKVALREELPHGCQTA